MTWNDVTKKIRDQDDSYISYETSADFRCRHCNHQIRVFDEERCTYCGTIYRLEVSIVVHEQKPDTLPSQRSKED